MSYEHLEKLLESGLWALPPWPRLAGQNRDANLPDVVRIAKSLQPFCEPLWPLCGYPPAPWIIETIDRLLIRGGEVMDLRLAKPDDLTGRLVRLNRALAEDYEQWNKRHKEEYHLPDYTGSLSLLVCCLHLWVGCIAMAKVTRPAYNKVGGGTLSYTMDDRRRLFKGLWKDAHRALASRPINPWPLLGMATARRLSVGRGDVRIVDWLPWNCPYWWDAEAIWTDWMNLKLGVKREDTRS
jgi:hypothetical protein